MTATLVALHSKVFPDKYLRMDGTGVSQFMDAGGGIVNTQTSIGPYETFVLERFGDGTVSFRSTIFDNVYLRLDAGTVQQGQDLSGGGGVVNCQFGSTIFEKFKIVQKPANPNTYTGIVGIESNGFSGRFLRVNGAQDQVNAQGVFLTFEEWEILVIG